MGSTIRFRLAAISLFFAIIASSCSFPAQALPTEAGGGAASTATIPPATATAPAPTPTNTSGCCATAAATAATTATPAPTLTQTIQASPNPTEQATVVVNPQCNILKDLSMYAGPGTAYLLQLEVVRAGTAVVPNGYDPAGNPGGSWVQVTDPVSKKRGWILAAADTIQCNMDVTTLAAVSVAPPAPACRSLQAINLYPGPGSAYWTNLALLPLNTLVTPTNYNPVGKPGGKWVYVSEPISQKKGWISASTQNIECNLDITSLPPKTVSAPPVPPPPHATLTFSSSNVCQNGKNGKTYDCAVVVSDNALLQVKVLKNGKEIGKAQGMDYVDFEVQDQVDASSYSYSDTDAPYCIFGASGGCNPWQYAGTSFNWSNYNTPLNTAHTFMVTIVIYSSSLSINLTWNGNFKFSQQSFPMQP